MNSSSSRLSATPPGICLAALDAIADGAARNFVIEMKAGRFHGFVIRRADAVFGFVDLCPHAGLPLAQKLDDYLTPDGSLITCGWHGALFTIETGACVGGPCLGQKLSPWPVDASDGRIVTA